MGSYDKHMEHMDQTPLGKLQQQYWTTKQQVIKKLGKKEDEFVVQSDAELDTKLDVNIKLSFHLYYFFFFFSNFV
jgi:islet cell auto antigen 1